MIQQAITIPLKQMKNQKIPEKDRTYEDRLKCHYATQKYSNRNKKLAGWAQQQTEDDKR